MSKTDTSNTDNYIIMETKTYTITIKNDETEETNTYTAPRDWVHNHFPNVFADKMYFEFPK